MVLYFFSKQSEVEVVQEQIQEVFFYLNLPLSSFVNEPQGLQTLANETPEVGGREREISRDLNRPVSRIDQSGKVPFLYLLLTRCSVKHFLTTELLFLGEKILNISITGTIIKMAVSRFHLFSPLALAALLQTNTFETKS